ncbi:TetR/AcrR family transcriptional regulator [Sneathiella limimaris]|uniref:TetR/AcrR family transcriptional regulator n=1 Tax=Sneathiella limimaris TaxID=1964213 RepID=UPI00146B3B2D|nr:TetR/AcrR family transcriptional regulator [Sneathiella limimaris]
MNTETDQEILEATIFVFANKLDGTLDDVAKKAGVSRVTINRRFGKKTDLLISAQKFSIRQFNSVLRKARSSKQNSMDKLLFVLTEYYRLRHHHLFLMRTLVDEEDKNRKNFARQLEVIEQLVKNAQARGYIRQELPPAWVAAFMDFLVITANSTRYRGIVAERDLRDHIWNTFKYGVAPTRTI